MSIGQAGLNFLSTLPERFGRPRTRGNYIPQIDGLRFLAIALVLVWHISLRASRHVDQLKHAGIKILGWYYWFPHGEIGVGLFFFVSGLVIAQPFLTRRQEEWRIGHFYLRRLRRIYPPYAIVLTLCLILVAVNGYSKRDFTGGFMSGYYASLFYLHGLIFDEPSRFNPPIWSLEVEVHFYLLVPFLLVLYLKLRSLQARLLVGAATVMALIAATSIVNFVYPFDGRFRLGLLAHMYLFVAGVVIADLASAIDPLRRSASPLFDLFLAAGLALLFAVGLQLTETDAQPAGGWPNALSNTTMLLAILLIYFGAMYGKLSRAILGQRWICLIGTMCFSIYLVHVVVIEGLSAMILRKLPLHDTPTIFGVYLLALIPASLAASLMFYIAIERPFMTSQSIRGSIGQAARKVPLAINRIRYNM